MLIFPIDSRKSQHALKVLWSSNVLIMLLMPHRFLCGRHRKFRLRLYLRKSREEVLRYSEEEQDDDDDDVCVRAL